LEPARSVRRDRDATVVAGLYLNAYSLRFVGEVELWRLPREADEDKRVREAELGVALWGERDAFWAVNRPPISEATIERIPARRPRGRVLFAAREAIVSHALANDREAWFGRAGEMSCLGLLPSQTIDRFVLEPQLVMRLVQERFVQTDSAVVVRARTRWRCAGTLADTDLRRHAVGEPAVRVSGSGPRRGHVHSVSADELQLRAAAETVSVSPRDYTLVAGSRFVAAWRGHDVLRELQVASGMLTVSNRRNQYAVKDRFLTAGRMLRGLGWPVPFPGGGHIELDSPLQIQMEGST